MWARKFLLLSCLYPLFLLFVIAYTVAYTVVKPYTTHTISQTGLLHTSRVLYSSNASKNISRVMYISRQPTAAAQNSPEPTPIASPAATQTELQQEHSVSMIPVSANATISAIVTTPIPTNQQLYQRAMQNRSVTILDQATSSAISVGSSSYIIEASPTDTLRNIINQPRSCAADEFC